MLIETPFQQHSIAVTHCLPYGNMIGILVCRERTSLFVSKWHLKDVHRLMGVHMWLRIQLLSRTCTQSHPSWMFVAVLLMVMCHHSVLHNSVVLVVHASLFTHFSKLCCTHITYLLIPPAFPWSPMYIYIVQIQGLRHWLLETIAAQLACSDLGDRRYFKNAFPFHHTPVHALDLSRTF